MDSGFHSDAQPILAASRWITLQLGIPMTLSVEKTMSGDRLARCVLRLPAALLLAVVLFASASSSAQNPTGGGTQPDFIPAGYDDYQNMLTQLGITKVRKGRDAR